MPKKGRKKNIKKRRAPPQSDPAGSAALPRGKVAAGLGTERTKRGGERGERGEPSRRLAAVPGGEQVSRRGRQRSRPPGPSLTHAVLLVLRGYPHAGGSAPRSERRPAPPGGLLLSRGCPAPPAGALFLRTHRQTDRQTDRRAAGQTDRRRRSAASHL